MKYISIQLNNYLIVILLEKLMNFSKNKIFYYFIEFVFRCLSIVRLRLIDPIMGRKKDNTLTTLNISRDDFIECNFKLPEKYLIRQFKEQDFLSYYLFLFRVNMGHCSLMYWKDYILPECFFIVEDIKTGSIVGSEFVARNPSDPGGESGTLGFLATDPHHKGTTIVWRAIIAYCLASKSTKRLLEEGFAINEVVFRNN